MNMKTQSNKFIAHFIVVIVIIINIDSLILVENENKRKKPIIYDK